MQVYGSMVMAWLQLDWRRQPGFRQRGALRRLRLLLRIGHCGLERLVHGSCGNNRLLAPNQSLLAVGRLQAAGGSKSGVDVVKAGQSVAPGEAYVLGPARD